MKFKSLNIPDLIVIDGGKGQLSSVISVFKKLKINNIDIISIAKKNEIIYLKNNNEIILNKKSDSLKLIQYLRNEAHNYCLKKHIILRNKNFINSELINIKGIGKKSVLKLYNKYKTLKIIKNLKKDDFIKILGNYKSEIIHKHFNN